MASLPLEPYDSWMEKLQRTANQRIQESLTPGEKIMAQRVLGLDKGSQVLGNFLVPQVAEERELALRMVDRGLMKPRANGFYLTQKALRIFFQKQVVKTGLWG
jgi:hypothetical protein